MLPTKSSAMEMRSNLCRIMTTLLPHKGTHTGIMGILFGIFDDGSCVCQWIHQHQSGINNQHGAFFGTGGGEQRQYRQRTHAKRFVAIARAICMIYDSQLGNKCSAEPDLN